MPKHVFVCGPRMEKPLRSAHLKTGRSLLGAIAGLALVTSVGTIAFVAGYPSGPAPSSSRDSEKAAVAALANGEETRAVSDRTRPEWLAKLASAPAASATADSSATGLETGALADRIEAAASVTGSISPPITAPKKAVRVVPLTAAKPAAAKPMTAAASNETARLPESSRPAATPTRKRAQAAPRARPTTLAGFFSRPGLSKGVAPPDPAR